MKKIITHEEWSFNTVRSMCIRENFYTCGTCTDYESILNFVEDSSPTQENIYKVAHDIANHSNWDDDNWSEKDKIENVAFCIVTQAITRWCEIA